MKTHLALLRGINLSGQKLIKMAELRELLEADGFENVATYIQSGNVILNTADDGDWVGKRIQTLIADRYGFEVTVIVINREKLESVIKRNPFASNDADVKQLYVAFLSEEPDLANIAKLMETSFSPDEAVVRDGVVYLKYAAGAGNTKLTNNLIESRLKVRATSRNWNTTLKLGALLSGPEKNTYF